MKVLILSGGKTPSEALLEKEVCWADYIICADHGYDMLKGFNRIPDLLVGDLDSIGEEKNIEAKEIDKYCPRKNDTDTGIALDRAIGLKAKEVHILGGTGTRLDHSLANIFLLEKYFDLDVKIKILDDRNSLALYGPGEYSFNKGSFKYISILAISDQTSYSTHGLEYEVTELVLQRYSNRGVSNEIKKNKATIRILYGKALIIESMD